MPKRLLLCLCLGLAATLAACADEHDKLPSAVSQKELKVERTELTHAAGFVHGEAKLAPGQADKLDAFLVGAHVGAEDHIYLEVARNDPLAAQRIGSVSHELAQHNIGAKVLTVPAASVGEDRLLIKVERYVVTLPSCPDWSKSPYSAHDNGVASNFGCATAVNLGLQVEDPRDLVVGRTLGPEEGDAALAGVDRYQQGKPKDFIGSSSGGGGYSPVTVQMPGSGSGSSGQ